MAKIKLRYGKNLKYKWVIRSQFQRCKELKEYNIITK